MRWATHTGFGWCTAKCNHCQGAFEQSMKHPAVAIELLRLQQLTFLRFRWAPGCTCGPAVVEESHWTLLGKMQISKRRESLFLVGSDMKGLYCHYKCHQSLLMLYSSSKKLFSAFLYPKTGSAVVLYTCMSWWEYKTKFIKQRNAQVAKVIHCATIDI